MLPRLVTGALILLTATVPTARAQSTDAERAVRATLARFWPDSA
ncbi:MAG TPA: hypothetical protein VKA54_08060 [Gemmatimonadaceae bacterium]|nr:hypothetical protein [Gemmatimonadaceae bacterium]